MELGLSGGEGLSRTLESIRRKLGGDRLVRVGFLENATYPDGQPVANVAAIQEFGTVTIPARPFFRKMISDKSPGWGATTSKLLQSTDFDGLRTLALMGEGISGQLAQSIRDYDDVPLAPSTVAKKGFDKQLIDTGHMVNSVASEVIGE